MRREHVSQMPVLDSYGRVVKLLLLQDLIALSQVSNPVVIMAGGKGTRLRPLTNDCPKPMLDIAGKPMLEIIINQFVVHGFKNFYISVNYLKDQIIDYFGDGSRFGISIQYLIENEPLGTAGSLSLLPSSINEPILVTNGDVLAKINPLHMLQDHYKSNSVATLAVRNYEHQVPYGVVCVDDDALVGFDEKPIHSCLINTGIYCINPSLLNYIDPSTFVDMPSILSTCISDNKKVSVYLVQSSWIDVGRPESTVCYRYLGSLIMS